MGSDNDEPGDAMATGWSDYRPLAFINKVDEEDEFSYGLQRLFCTDIQPTSLDDEPTPRSGAYSGSMVSRWMTRWRPWK